jgi:uncharacterized membrane protein YtjA (UPF0391 family)
MLKWAVFLLVLSLIAGAMGFANISEIAKRISIVLFTVFFLMFLGLLLFAWLVAGALQGSGVVEPSAGDLIKSAIELGAVLAQHMPLDLAGIGLRQG